MSDVALEEEYEVNVLPAGSKPPEETAPLDDKVTLTKAEHAALLAGQSGTQQLGSQFDNLAKQLQQQNRPANVPEQKSTESDAEFAARIEGLLFQQGGSITALREVIQKEGSPVIARLEAELARVNAKLAKQDSRYADVNADYADEVDEYLARLPMAQRSSQEALDWAHAMVRSKHHEEIVEKRVQAELTKRAKDAEASGSGASDVKPKPGSPHMESRSTSAGGGPRKVYIDQKELTRLVQREHMTEDQAKAYLARKAAK